MTRHRRWSILTTQLIALSGCAFQPQVSRMAVEYNEFVAQATNRQTLINILRARDREPLHFTTITTVHGQATLTGTAGLTTGLPGIEKGQVPVAGSPGKFTTTTQTIGSDIWTPNVGVTIATGTTFDIGINATDDFWKGILTPVAPSTFAYYLDQGWSTDLLTYLLVERIDYSVIISNRHGSATYDRVASVTNVVDNEDEIDRFKQVIKCRPLILQTKPQRETFLPFRRPVELNGVAKDTIATLHVPEPKAPSNPDPTRPAIMTAPDTDATTPYIQLRSGESITTLGMKPLVGSCLTSDTLIQTGMRERVAARYLLDSTAPPGRPRVSVPPLTATAVRPAAQQEQAATPDQAAMPASGGAAFVAANACRPLVKPNYKCDIATSIAFRSIESVIYFLGQYVRTNSLRPNLPGGVPIISLYKIDPSKRPAALSRWFVEVDYKGIRYALPSGETVDQAAGRSSDVVTLVQQMLNLHRTAKDLPSTPTVRIVN